MVRSGPTPVQREAFASAPSPDTLVRTTPCACGCPGGEFRKPRGSTLVVCFSEHKGVSELLNQARLPFSQKNVLRVLLEHERGSGQCWMSVLRLMLATGLRSRQSIFTHLRALEALGLVTRQTPGGTNTRRCNVYHLHWEALVPVALAPPPSPRKKSQRKTSTASQPRTSSGQVPDAGHPSAPSTEPPADAALRHDAAPLDNAVPLQDVVPVQTALALAAELPGETAPTEAPPGGVEASGSEKPHHAAFEDLPPAEVTIFEDIFGLQDLPEHGKHLPEDGDDLLEDGSEKPGKDQPGEDSWLASAVQDPLPTPQTEAPDEVASASSQSGLTSDAKRPHDEPPKRGGALVRPGVAQARPALQLVEETPSTPSSRAGTNLAITPRLLWGLWREAYEAAYLRPYLACLQDERVFPGLVDACQKAVGHRLTICPHEDPTSLARRYLQHVFAAFLRRPGRDEFLRKRGHPLALILADLNALGVPWRPPPRQPPREEPKQEVPPPLAEAARKVLKSLDEVRGKSIPRPRIVKRLG